MHNIKTFLIQLLFALFSASTAMGQALGSDFWTSYFLSTGLFSPHVNNCDSTTEAFVAIAGSQLGYCIEKDERNAGATSNWDEAREDCAQDGKRLPEPGEFVFACVYGAGINNMQDDYEWASNFLSEVYNDSATGPGTAAPILGSGGCRKGTWGWTTRMTSPDPHVYRCVR